MKIAFVLLTYNPDEPAGIERSVGSLAAGLRELGHQVITIVAGPASATDKPDLVRLDSVTLVRPMLFDDLPRVLADPGPVRDEVRGILVEHHVDVVCWADAVVGLGYLAPAPDGVRTALMAHLVRGDSRMHESLAHKPDAVLAASSFLVSESARAGVDTTGWQVLPNPLPRRGTPPPSGIREGLRRTGPLRTLARPDPVKGITGLLRAIPDDFDRPVQVVLADAGFELWRGMQDDVRRECQKLAEGRPQIELLPPLPWDEVQDFLAEAALAMMPTTWPETFGNVAAEALSAGTPVVGFHLGNLPHLVGTAGALVELGPAAEVHHISAVTSRNAQPPGAEEGFARLWAATTALLSDPDGYHAASEQAVRQVAGYEPAAVASTFLRCVGVHD
ncbi:glycosyltransferase family 4 protein [Kitasatospora sp. NPDC098663]|uniref:glycosyltransferase family 4 protein n=1 Tax=Kitasatospora sp. NPDC098663 TaxID=3364096 RepID=UPI0038003935